MKFLNLIWRAEEEKPNLGEEVRKYVQSKDIERKIEAASPYIKAALISWPVYWLYRGWEWGKIRHHSALRPYIRKTFFQAKAIQFCIIMTGVIATINQDEHHTLLETSEG